MIILKDSKRCPACGAKNSVRWDQRTCNKCFARMFRPTDDFPAILADSILSFWVFFSPSRGGTFQGWVHSAHLSNPSPNIGPIELKSPEKGYGTKRPNLRHDAKFLTPDQIGMERYKAAEA